MAEPEPQQQKEEENTKKKGRTISVSAAIPNFPNAAAVYEKLASPSKWKEWRSKKHSIKLLGGTETKEPLEKDAEFIFGMGIMRCTLKVLDCSGSSTTDGALLLFHECGGSFWFGLGKAHMRTEIATDNDGVVTVTVTETQSGMIKPPEKEMREANETMLKDLNISFVVA
jgi:hypothetical protein